MLICFHSNRVDQVIIHRLSRIRLLLLKKIAKNKFFFFFLFFQFRLNDLPQFKKRIGKLFFNLIYLRIHV